MSTEYSSPSSHIQFFNEERESLFKKPKRRVVGQEVSFPSSAAALLLKLEQGTFFWLRLCPYSMWFVIPLQNILKPVEERKGYIF